MTIPSAGLAVAGSLLFVPGDRPDRFGKAAASGAGVVIVDLEDAVATADKDRARDHAADWLSGGNRAVVRINPPGTPWSEADIAMAAEYACPVMIPKAESRAVVADVASQVTGPLILLVETALGVEQASQLCATSSVVRAAFGNLDLSTALGIDPTDRTALLHSRSRLVIASAAAGIAPPIDGVTTDIRNGAVLRADIEHARRLGFTGKLCIHPAQLAAVDKGFRPSPQEEQWARTVLDAGESATTVGGQMVDKPVLERARRILAAARTPRSTA